MMRLAYWFFLVAILAGLAGMGLGIRMGIVHDFTMMPVHAHVNLLGWASMFLYGLYYRAEPAAERTGLATIHFALAVAGLVLMTGGLALMLQGNPALMPVTIAGSFSAVAAMAVFLVVVVRRGIAEARTARMG
jgi:hypothetical protein